MAEPNREEIARADWFAQQVGIVATIFRFLHRTIGPIVDLAIRLFIAQSFFVSAVLKLADWPNALRLATYEYPVSWMKPVTAAYLGVSIELVGALLLAFGLATRFGALAALILVLIVHTNYAALDVNLLEAALLGWLVIRGAGPISLDHLLRQGLADAPLPFAAAFIRGQQRLSRFGTPIYQLLLRVWSAGTIVATVTALVKLDGAGTWLPLDSARAFMSPLEVLLAALIVVGFATRFAALFLMLASLALHALGGGYAEHTLWVMLFALFVVHGAGWYSIDGAIDRALRSRFPQLDGKPAFSLDGLPRVVVVGAGFAGIACANALSKARVSVTLIDRHNYHLFQPLLYQVATASLSPGDIAAPVRGLFRESFNVRVLLGEVTGIDKAAREVQLGKQRIRYDYLVLATGAAHSYFGRDEWAPYAPGLKRVEDATEVRRRLLTAFERAEATEDPAEREALLTFLIVGAGPTGVELAGAIAQLARLGMEKDFRRFDPAQAKILLVQSGPRVLPTFPEDLSEATARSLTKLGVDIRLNSRVEAIDADGATVNGEKIRARTVLWAAGVIASPAAKWLGCDADNAGRVKVGDDLTVAGMREVFVVGDTALSNAWKGKPVPGLAPAAKQAGMYVAKAIRARVEGRRDPGAFVYRHVGSLATIGRKAAVVDFGYLKFSGALAWWFWGAIHVGFLVDVRSRLSVLFDWGWAYLTYRSGTRLITGTPPAAPRA